jgi:lipoprotein-anchoring transpeptidase ErfK/SrfK
MVGDTPIYTALVTTGKDGWDTPVGTWYINTRVASETMSSASIGAEEYYVLEDVAHTQYFTTVGHALHENYWRDPWVFGSTRSSHGCVGMRTADAAFFWDFVGIGSRVVIHGDGSAVPSI